MKRIVLLVVALLAVPAAEACALPPFFGNADMERNKQNTAVRFDPYPSVGMGPDVVGGRPREYMDPLPSVVLLQNRPLPEKAKRPHSGWFFHRAW